MNTVNDLVVLLSPSGQGAGVGENGQRRELAARTLFFGDGFRENCMSQTSTWK